MSYRQPNVQAHLLAPLRGRACGRRKGEQCMQAPCSPHVHRPCCVTTLRCALQKTTGLAKKDDVYAFAHVTQIGTAHQHCHE
jgi:hypothetical protein